MLKLAVSPIKFLIWPDAMFKAEPVMKAVIAVNGMNSTIQPHRINPMKVMIAPDIIANAEAMTGAGISGCSFWTEMITFPVRVDMTATGCSYVSFIIAKRRVQLTPMVISLEVAKNQ